jgi:hypothetical protein
LPRNNNEKGKEGAVQNNQKIMIAFKGGREQGSYVRQSEQWEITKWTTSSFKRALRKSYR